MFYILRFHFSYYACRQILVYIQQALNLDFASEFNISRFLIKKKSFKNGSTLNLSKRKRKKEEIILNYLIKLIVFITTIEIILKFPSFFFLNGIYPMVLKLSSID